VAGGGGGGALACEAGEQALAAGVDDYANDAGMLQGGVSGSQEWRQLPRLLRHCPSQLYSTRARSGAQHVVVVITQHRPSMHEGPRPSPAFSSSDAARDRVEIGGGEGGALQQVVERVFEAQHALLPLEVEGGGGAAGGRR